MLDDIGPVLSWPSAPLFEPCSHCVVFLFDLIIVCSKLIKAFFSLRQISFKFVYTWKVSPPATSVVESSVVDRFGFLLYFMLLGVTVPVAACFLGFSGFAFLCVCEHNEVICDVYASSSSDALESRFCGSVNMAKIVDDIRGGARGCKAL